MADAVHHPDAAAREVTSDDVNSIATLRAEARRAVVDARGGRSHIEKDHPDHVGEAIVSRAIAGATLEAAIAGTLDEVVVGFALAHRESSDVAEPVATIEELWVTPEAREMGVGEELVAAVVRWAAQHGCVALDADALPGDRATKNFFEQHGLVARGIRVQRRLDEGAP